MLLCHAQRIFQKKGQREVAERTGIIRRELSLIEQGRLTPTDDERRRLAKELRLPPDRLLDHFDESTLLGPGAEARDCSR